MVERETLTQTTVEFAAFLAILIVGAVLVGWANQLFTGVTGDAVTVLLFAAMVVAALGLVALTGAESGVDAGSTLAGVGGAIGFLTAEVFLALDPAIGAAVGAGVGAIAGFGLARVGIPDL